MKRWIFFLLFYFFAFFTEAQIPVKTWRDHLPYRHGKRVAEIENKVFCATTGGMFSYNKTDNSLKKYSKVSGLSDVDISTINYSNENKVLLIAYLNGNLDLIRNDTIYNLPDIKLKTISGDKKINSIFFYQSYAYLACGFGISVVDLQKMVIKDSYFFGPAGSQIQVNDIAFDGQNIYAATKSGIYKADINHPNLVDYNAWSQVLTLPDANAEYSNIAFFNNKFLTIYKNASTNTDAIITFNHLNWQIWEHSNNDHYIFLTVYNNHLLLSSYFKTEIYDENAELVKDFDSYLCQHAIIDKDGIIWFADYENGLGKLTTQGIGFYAPNGPAYTEVGDIVVHSGILWAGGGTFASQWSGRGAYSFSDETWKSYNSSNFPELSEFYNISRVAIDPFDLQHVYGGSLGYGVVEFQNGNVVDIFDETDGVLETISGFGHGFVNVTGINFDNNGNCWISTSLSKSPVYLIKRDKSWEKLKFNYSNFGINNIIGDILPTSFNQIWLVMEKNGLFVFTYENNSVTRERAIKIINQEGETLEYIYSIAEDKEGNIWIGSNKGPAIFFNPGDIFEDENPIGYQIKIPRNDGTNNADILLSTAKITSIAVDGGNRKWLGTENSGVFLVSEDGKEEIHHFTAENSPLLSNNITTIAINHKNGEVFFGTDKGICSFRGQSTEGNDDFSKVYVFPNPVRENYQGDITITGLVDNVNIKITDVSGNLVYETKALGGQATWDGKNFRGQKVFTGVYLVFCTNEDGSKTFITKLLFIH
jgi:hypothetical protein